VHTPPRLTLFPYTTLFRSQTQRISSERLQVGEEAVKTRLHRARAMIRRGIAARIGSVAPGAFELHATRCDRVVRAVLERLASTRSEEHTSELQSRGHLVCR